MALKPETTLTYLTLGNKPSAKNRSVAKGRKLLVEVHDFQPTIDGRSVDDVRKTLQTL